MELILVIAAIIYSIWSEVNKKKEEDNVDINFSELSSLDEFFKPDQKKNSAAKKKTSQQPVSHKSLNYDEMPGLTRQANYDRAGESNLSEQVNYDRMPGPTRKVNRDRSKVHREEVNYDKLEAVTAKTNYERSGVDGLPSDHGLPSARIDNSHGDINSSADQKPLVSKEDLRFGRNDLLKAFVMSEVMQRYDLNRIYSRIPGVKSEE